MERSPEDRFSGLSGLRERVPDVEKRFAHNRDDRRLSDDFWPVGKHNWTFGGLTNVQVNTYTKV